MLTALARTLRSVPLPIVMMMTMTTMTWLLTAGRHLHLLHLHFHVHLPSRAGGAASWLLPALLVLLQSCDEWPSPTLSHPCLLSWLSCECVDVGVGCEAMPKLEVPMVVDAELLSCRLVVKAVKGSSGRQAELGRVGGECISAYTNNGERSVVGVAY